MGDENKKAINLSTHERCCDDARRQLWIPANSAVRVRVMVRVMIRVRVRVNEGYG